MKTRKILGIILVFTTIFQIRCTSKRVVDQPLPNRDIVYQLATHYDGGGGDRIGFINSEGNGETYLHTEGVQAVVRPAWKDDGSLLLFTHPASFIEGITKEGFRKRIKDLWAPESNLIHNSEKLLAKTEHKGKYAIKKVNINSGEVLEIFPVGTYLIDESKEGINIGTNSIYKQLIIYQRYLIEDDGILHQELRVLDTKTNQFQIILHYKGKFESVKRIINPAVSPDGEWIAYTSNDGIYLIRLNGSENKRIVKSIVNYTFWPPTASWSPDGKWIVYHRCTLNSKQDCRYNVEDSDIFKYNLETGEEVLLLEGGVNPYWRWGE